MSEYFIEATAEQDRGLAAAAAAYNAEHEADEGFEPLEPEAYLALRVSDVLDSYARQYPAPARVEDIKAAVESASPDAQARIAAILAEDAIVAAERVAASMRAEAEAAERGGR